MPDGTGALDGEDCAKQFAASSAHDSMSAFLRGRRVSPEMISSFNYQTQAIKILDAPCSV